MGYRVTAPPSGLSAEIEDIHKKMSLTETEESCDKIQQGILDLTERYDIGGCKVTTEVLASIRSLSKPLSIVMKSERTMLSCSAIELVTAFAAHLGPSFEPLVSLFVPTLLELCVRTDQVLRTLAKACIFALIENTLTLRPSLLPYIAELDESAALRSLAAGGILACLNSASFSLPNIPSDTRARLIEDVIELNARGHRADIRTAGKDISDTHKVYSPDRAASFVPLCTPLTEDVAVQGTVDSRSTSVTSQRFSNRRSTTGRVNAVGCLKSQKITSGKQTNPLISKLPQDIPIARPTAVPKQAQSTLRPPSVPGPLSMQSGNPQRDRDVARPLVSTTRLPQWVGNMLESHGKQPHVREGTQVAPVQTAHTRPTSVKPITKGDPENNVTKIPSLCSTSAAAVRPSKAEHHMMKFTSSRIPRMQPHGPPSTEVEVQTSSQASHKEISSQSNKEAMRQGKLVLGGESFTKGPKPVVKAPTICSTLCGMKNSRKPVLPEEQPATEGPKPVVKAPLIRSRLCRTENPGKLVCQMIYPCLQHLPQSVSQWHYQTHLYEPLLMTCSYREMRIPRTWGTVSEELHSDHTVKDPSSYLPRAHLFRRSCHLPIFLELKSESSITHTVLQLISHVLRAVSCDKYWIG
ncbi:hypothetical protein K503DRAFT_553243 [Rhizopogon vinicolor AM-OR11-026]|uniref:CLASP N-terminal domain-containing protein n=1 Tax=Rhizopogon vinicolor AM-OR11-026 TaxID=1314800 RepID=A0A1B7MKI0_9AGAM|nr:hypothetical protein K503DRAFT_553243 [Rhizopogon vinicolor AM-OR11-026]